MEPLAEGSISDFTLWFGPLPIRWTARHSHIDPLHGFTDTQVRGPDGLAPRRLRGRDVLAERELEIAPGPLPLAEYFVHFPACALLVDTGDTPAKGVP
jgi:hypothetical protein